MCTSGCGGESEIPLKAGDVATVARANEVIRAANPGADNPPLLTASDDGRTARFPLADNQRIESALRATGDKDLMALAGLVADRHAQELASKQGLSLAGTHYKPGISTLLFTGMPRTQGPISI